MGWSLPYPLTGYEVSYRVSEGIRGVYAIWGDKDTHPLYYGKSDGTPTSCVRKRLLSHANPNDPKGSKVVHMLLKTGDAGKLYFQYINLSQGQSLLEAFNIARDMPTANRKRELKPLSLD
jgi:hypothetical protein